MYRKAHNFGLLAYIVHDFLLYLKALITIGKSKEGYAICKLKYTSNLILW